MLRLDLAGWAFLFCLTCVFCKQCSSAAAMANGPGLAWRLLPTYSTYTRRPRRRRRRPQRVHIHNSHDLLLTGCWREVRIATQ
ncbi:hypothetical protein QBC47DRAFT_374408 [Echria macrotheca]|uniref:Secreted protein n=1 Tax=Echria macrotheca TaxID=438768 RepID=A0AAJ0BI19_9PEZI|nr:hypothetical protein QBC47DRAFT_374408 [Echria macrotheca]